MGMILSQFHQPTAVTIYLHRIYPSHVFQVTRLPAEFFSEIVRTFLDFQILASFPAK